MDHRELGRKAYEKAYEKQNGLQNDERFLSSPNCCNIDLNQGQNRAVQALIILNYSL